MLQSMTIRLLNANLIKFAVVGATTTTLDWCLFALLTVKGGLDAVPANLTSYSCGIATSFLLNRFWVFRHSTGSGTTSRQAGRFAASNAIGLGLSTALVALFAMMMPELLGKFISIPIVFVWNYSLARHWVFR